MNWPPKRNETWESAFEYWLDNVAEGDDYENGTKARDLVQEWLRMADSQIKELVEDKQ